ncbi:hypothetical protein Hdeb2414_s0010g00348181 [Helianthus debilis subsp. tardiflorus]
MFCSYLKVTGFFGGNRFNTIERDHQFLQLIRVSFNGSMFVFQFYFRIFSSSSSFVCLFCFIIDGCMIIS